LAWEKYRKELDKLRQCDELLAELKGNPLKAQDQMHTYVNKHLMVSGYSSSYNLKSEILGQETH